MSRDVGQVRARAAVVGLLLAVLVLAAVVLLCGWLVPEGAAMPDIEAPAEADPLPGEVRCPAGLPAGEPVPVESAALFDCPRLYDGVRVRYTGEAIAAVLPRGDRAWVQLNDDVYALGVGPLAEHRTTLGGNAGIAVSLPAEVAAAITHVGGARASGDIVEVEGTYLRADPADGGGPAIQAERAAIVRQGRPLEQSASPRRIAVALSLAAVALGLLAALRWRRGAPR